jgi:hypothetical protein
MLLRPGATAAAHKATFMTDRATLVTNSQHPCQSLAVSVPQLSFVTQHVSSSKLYERKAALVQAACLLAQEQLAAVTH